MPSSRFEIEERLDLIRGRFVRYDAFEQLSDEFDRLLGKRRFDLFKGKNKEARGLAIVGGPGSGKTTALDRILDRHLDLIQPNDGNSIGEIIRLGVPSPATLKFVGGKMLSAVGYRGNHTRRTGPAIWDIVRDHLALRKTLFVHFDEAQDFLANTKAGETQDVINAIKAIMQNTHWPVGVILSGTEKLRTLLDTDDQLNRRLIPIRLPEISAATHSGIFKAALESSAQKVGLRLADDLLQSEFYQRLIHASAKEFGMTYEIIVGAAECAFETEDSVLERAHFHRAFHRRSGCTDVMNPFIATNFHAINARKLLHRSEDHQIDVADGLKRRRS